MFGGLERENVTQVRSGHTRRMLKVCSEERSFIFTVKIKTWLCFRAVILVLIINNLNRARKIIETTWCIFSYDSFYFYERRITAHLRDTGPLKKIQCVDRNQKYCSKCTRKAYCTGTRHKIHPASQLCEACSNALRPPIPIRRSLGYPL